MRRLFIGILVFAAISFATYDTLAADVRIRKHVDDMSQGEWAALANAIQALRALDRKDASGNFIVPQNVDSYERFVQIHGNAVENGACRHRNELVWFWHRAFLLHFENRLRATNPPTSANITLPYWDWTELATGAKGYPKAYEDSGPLNHDRNDHTSTAATAAPLVVASDGQIKDAKAFVEALLHTNSWAEFGGTAAGPDQIKGFLEAKTHDGIHGAYIGKNNLNNKLAARDAIFWAHHANLDRLVDAWQERHPATAAAPHCLECNAEAYDRDQQLGPLKVSDVLSNASIKGTQVIYAPKSAPALVAQAQTAPAPTSETLTASAAFALTLPAQSVRNAVLVIPDIVINSAVYHRGDVYLVPQGVAFVPSRAFKERYRIAVFGNFDEAPDSSHAGHGVASPARVAIRLGAALDRLPTEERGKQYQIIINFVAVESEIVTMATTPSSVTHGTPQLRLDGITDKAILPLERQ